MMAMVEDQAPELSSQDLRTAARLVAAWHPPTAREAVAPAAAAVTDALADRALEGMLEGTLDGSSTAAPGSGGSDTAAEAAVLAEALEALRPWVMFRGGPEFRTLGRSSYEEAEYVDGDDGSGDDEASREASARNAVAALLRWPGVAGAAEPAALHAVVSAAAAYGVEVPRDLARAAASLASMASTSLPAAALAARLIAGSARSGSAAAGRSGAASSSGSVAPGDAPAPGGLGAAAATATGSGTGELLTDREVRSLAAARLEPKLGPAQHTAFLAALQEVSVLAGGAAGGGEGLLVALGSAAPGLGPDALALAMECAAAAVPTDGAFGGGGGAATAEDKRAAAVRQLLSGAVVVAARGPGPECSPTQLCQLAAAAVRLHRAARGADGAVGQAAVESVLTAVRHATLTDASIQAAAALVAAVVPHTEAVLAATPEGAAPAADGTGLRTAVPVPAGLLDVLLSHMAKSTAEADARIEAEASQASAAVETDSDVDVAGFGTTISASPHRRTAPTLVPRLSYEQATAVLAAITAAAEEAPPPKAAAAAAATTAPASGASAPPAHPPLSAHRVETLRAAGIVAARALVPTVPRLDAACSTRLLHLLGRAARAGVRPNHPPLLWALHERLRVLAYSLSSSAALEALRGCVALRWRPTVLIRELLQPLLRKLQAAAGVEAPDEEGLRGRGSRDSGGAAEGAAAGGWSPAEVKEALVLLACLGSRGQMPASVLKYGMSYVLESHAVAVAAPPTPFASTLAGRGGAKPEAVAAAGPAGGRLSPEDASQLLWVCVALRYRGVTVLRPLMHLLLQTPASSVPVRAVAQAVWAAARLGVVGERLVRWAFACCQGAGKLSSAPPQSLAMLCWGLGRLGVRPPRAFLAAVGSAALAQLSAYRPQELSTLLFMLATWGARLGLGPGATDGTAAGVRQVVRHVVAHRDEYDAPALCNAVWALQRLAPAPSASGQDPAAAEVEAAEAEAGPLDAAALAAVESRLLEFFPPHSDTSVANRIPDHQLLRFFDACAGAGTHRPSRLLAAYTAGLRRRLDALSASLGGNASTADVAAAADRRCRFLWAAATSLSRLGVRDPRLLSSLELACERLQRLLAVRPAAMAGVLYGMATLNYFPSHWADRGLLRSAGLALKEADVRESGLILEAMGKWRPDLEAAAAVAGAAAAAAADGQGNGTGAAAGGPPARPNDPAKLAQRLDLMRSVTVARLTELLVPPPAPPPAPAAAAGPDQAAAARLPVAPPAAAAAATVTLDDAMRLLTALASLRWSCPPVASALLAAAAELPARRRRRVPELTTLLWALAALRQDSPELLDDLQVALMGLPRQRPLSEEMALLESGRAADLAAAAKQEPAAAAAATAPEAEATTATATAERAAAKAEAEAEPEVVAATNGNGNGNGNHEAATAAETTSPRATSVPVGAPPTDELLVRPPKPAAAASDGAAAPATFDPAAATAAAAAAVNQRHEALMFAAGRGRIATEPWQPVDVFKALWAAAKMNRHPGPQILAAAERSWMSLTEPAAEGDAAAAGAAAGAARPPLHAVTGLLWSLAVFRHHNGSFARSLAEQLAARLSEEEAAFGRQAMQVAACLLAAQADRVDSPLNTALPAEARSRLVAAWRARLAARVATPPNRYQADLVGVLRKMGLVAAPNVATPDGCVLVDVAVALPPASPAAASAAAAAAAAAGGAPQPRLLALELMGRHNCAANSPRVMGEAVIKYRLLQARGYLVVPIPCAEWDRIGHQDVWSKMVYLQSKIDRRTAGPMGGAFGAREGASEAGGANGGAEAAESIRRQAPKPLQAPVERVSAVVSAAVGPNGGDEAPLWWSE
ncbi:hypothetical protein HYH03_001758 [Edaphochlamys debaryana]|uniref:RAP domain-containing protein n=1 Tax=Edaphochlamys debaryana TaxID=47281 RepID=A0A835YCN2_9CHLO|nr:hypothetical protein HYH03_001758 [Edaphochlamys debaryana]|eukprot:KAG2500176.1 hypothetical protein HYH03_001758 [Edaphochlamys debaryana]